MSELTKCLYSSTVTMHTINSCKSHLNSPTLKACKRHFIVKISQNTVYQMNVFVFQYFNDSC